MGYDDTLLVSKFNLKRGQRIEKSNKKQYQSVLRMFIKQGTGKWLLGSLALAIFFSVTSEPRVIQMKTFPSINNKPLILADTAERVKKLIQVIQSLLVLDKGSSHDTGRNISGIIQGSDKAGCGNGL